MLIVGALLASFAWATASPHGSSPDEDFHLTSIWCPTPLDQSCATKVRDDGTTLVEVPRAVSYASLCIAFDSSASGECVADLDKEPVWGARVDNGGFPGGFYDVMHWFVGPDVAASVMTMRIANAVLAIALFAAVTALSTPQARRVLVYGYLTISVPMAIYLIASVNPSGWAITGVAVAWAGLHGFLTQPEPRRRYALAGLALTGAGLAAMARADAGAFLGVVAAAIVALHFPALRTRLRDVLAPVLVAVIGVIGFLYGGQSGALEGGLVVNRTPGGRALLVDNFLGLPDLLIGSQKDALNWVDTPVPALTWVPIVLAAGALAFLGLRALNLPKTIALLGLVGVYVALPLYMLQISGAPVGTYVQARYLTPLVPVIMATALWNPLQRRVPRLTFTQSALVFGALSIGHSAVLHTQIRRFVTGLDVSSPNLNTNIEWWVSPVSPMATWMVGSLGFALLALSLFLVGRNLPGDEVAGGVVRVCPVSGSVALSGEGGGAHPVLP
ncbi:DUF2142 domain-containing protein [Xylanimonas protaetiae]|uniref:DUF2142 domain-containing protein n=1 Tax=Xylanimonas protaetiae TaxID=2509457 RepID=UPI0013EA8E21|nr:DUF2142 domain-containing protein [Xylanimonas protaetiae]